MSTTPRSCVLMRAAGLAAILAALMGGTAFSLFANEAEAVYRIGFQRYRITPRIVDNTWTTPDAAVKTAAKAMRWQHITQCEAAVFDSDNDGSVDDQVGVGNCIGDGPRHIFYGGGDRSNHPGTRGFTHSSGHSSNADGGNPLFIDAGIADCASSQGGTHCTFDQLVTFHTTGGLGGY